MRPYRLSFMKGTLVLLALASASGPSRAAEPTAPRRETTMKALLSRHVGFSLLKQLTLADLIEESKGWRASISEGVLWFEDGVKHPIQILGSEAEADGSWLWAWGNEASNFPPAVVEASGRLRAIGKERGIPELVTGMLMPPHSDGHRLAIVACGLLGCSSYYRGPYQGGAAFFLFTDFPRRDQLDQRPERLITVIGTAISTFEVDHAAVVRGLAEDLGLKLSEKPGALILTAANGNRIEVKLGPKGEITSMGGTIGK